MMKNSNEIFKELMQKIDEFVEASVSEIEKNNRSAIKLSLNEAKVKAYNIDLKNIFRNLLNKYEKLKFVLNLTPTVNQNDIDEFLINAFALVIKMSHLKK